jgi:hypothetical protein
MTDKHQEGVKDGQKNSEYERIKMSEEHTFSLSPSPKLET